MRRDSFNAPKMGVWYYPEGNVCSVRWRFLINKVELQTYYGPGSTWIHDSYHPNLEGIQGRIAQLEGIDDVRE